MLEWIVSGSFLILVVLVLRAALGQKISARFRYALWALVLLRLLVPVQLFTSPVAGMTVQVSEQVREKMAEKSIYAIPIDRIPVEEAEGYVIGEDGQVGDANSFGYAKLENNGEIIVRYADKLSPLQILQIIWFLGGMVLLFTILINNLRFMARLRRVRKPLETPACRIPVYVADGLPSPCLFGVLRPAVYLTAKAAENPDILRHVLVHELTHYRHLDHIWSILRGVALAVHWWNPLVWLAVVYSRRDGELACDEGALKGLGRAERTAYGETLLALVTAKPSPRDLLCCATTMSGEKRSLRERIRRIACESKQAVSALVAAVIVISVTSACAFGRAEQTESDHVEETQSITEDTLDRFLDALSEEDISDFTGQDRITAARLVGLLQAAVPTRTNPMYMTERGNWLGWGIIWEIPLADGSGLYLHAIDARSTMGENSIYIAWDNGADLVPMASYHSEELHTLADELGGEVPKELLPYVTDLNRDGKLEQLRVQRGPGGIPWRLIVDGMTWESIRMICSEWRALFLCKIDGEDYLLQYTPEVSNGSCEYRYQLIDLTGRLYTIRQKGSVSFDIDFGAGGKFNPKKIAAFMDEVNGLLENSVQILNGDERLQQTFEKEGRLYDSLWWLDGIRDNNLSMRENLEAYRDNAGKEESK